MSISRNEEFGEDIFEIPIKRLAVELLAQFLPRRHVTVVTLQNAPKAGSDFEQKANDLKCEMNCNFVK